MFDETVTGVEALGVSKDGGLRCEGPMGVASHRVHVPVVQVVTVKVSVLGGARHRLDPSALHPVQVGPTVNRPLHPRGEDDCFPLRVNRSAPSSSTRPRAGSLEKALVEHVRSFLMELGVGFAFVGQQVHLEIGDEDFYLDLLFYHLRLRRCVVVELKTESFKPEYAGQLNFYLSAVDDLHRDPDHDGPSIGLLLCKSKNGTIVEYALRDTSKPIGVADWRLTRALPESLVDQLPTVDALEAEFAEEF